MQAHEIDARTHARGTADLTTRPAGPDPGGGMALPGLRVSRTTTRDKPLQFVPREPIPHAQRRERNRLRPVRIETEQPRPDQAV
jgi:hypothetical protein